MCHSSIFCYKNYLPVRIWCADLQVLKHLTYQWARMLPSFFLGGGRGGCFLQGIQSNNGSNIQVKLTSWSVYQLKFVYFSSFLFFLKVTDNFLQLIVLLFWVTISLLLSWPKLQNNSIIICSEKREKIFLLTNSWTSKQAMISLQGMAEF